MKLYAQSQVPTSAPYVHLGYLASSTTVMSGGVASFGWGIVAWIAIGAGIAVFAKALSHIRAEPASFRALRIVLLVLGGAAVAVGIVIMANR